MRYVRCVNINNTHDAWYKANPITLGKVYPVISIKYGHNTTRVINDKGNEQGYCCYRFKEIFGLNKNIKVL